MRDGILKSSLKSVIARVTWAWRENRNEEYEIRAEISSVAACVVANAL